MASAGRDIGTGDLSGVVTDSSSGQPISGAVVFATIDTVPGAPVSNFSTVTDAEGRFLLTDVPAGARVIEARMLGFTRERHVMTVRRGAVDSLSLELRSGEALLLQQLEVLRIPTPASPCRPSDVSAAWISGALADALAVTAAPAPGVRLPAIAADRIRLVLKPGLCQRALAAWQKRSGIANPFAQVYLFDLGGDGWALFDPAQALGNSTAIVPVLDRDFKVIATLAF
ncbi:MAG: carboxypeptidase-like regulatory domain-containing protein [Gemmatimonadetes bacterium]|nr:carboxypeptidase-like regulatory domain-containing protein [Gemmatimonadota bacterium]